ncbi:TIGR00730 family Rossman fold protein [Pseudonocardia benzenivorans]
MPDRYVDLATQVGTAIAARGWDLVSGGGRVSMMGAVATAARAGGSRTIGVIPRSLVDREVADTAADELLVTDTMRERKALMEAHAGAFLALPGGIGTCEELFEVWTAATLGMHDKPVVLLDPDDHWSGLLDWLAALVRRGFAGRAALDRLVVTADVSRALDACAPRPDVTASVS